MWQQIRQDNPATLRYYDLKLLVVLRHNWEDNEGRQLATLPPL